MDKDRDRGSVEERGLVLLEKALAEGLQVELIKQLNKDLALSGIGTSLSEDLAPGALVLELKSIVHNLIRDDFQGFLNLLYRADVAQSKMSRSESTGLSEYIDLSTYELLKREWQKVWIRNKIQ